MVNGKMINSVGVAVIVALLLTSVPALAGEVGYEDSRCLTWAFDSAEYGHLFTAEPGVAPGDGSKAPPDNPDVGDSWLWWLMYHDGGPYWEEDLCTVRGEGTNCYVVVENSQWNVNIDQADVNAIVNYFDNTSPGDPSRGIYEINSSAFGTPPDMLDNDPKIYVLYYDFGISSDGFFSAWDMDPSEPYSNECEVVYLNCATSADPGGEYLNGVVAHEFEHMIHWLYDSNESPWVDEGCGELAMFLFGHPDDISSFNSNPDDDLTDWGGQWTDYIQTYLWTLYLYEQYGGEDTIYDLVHEPANSVAGVNNTLAANGYSEDMADVFDDWVIANYLDNDDPGFFGGKYGYSGEDLPPFNPFATYSSFPVDASATVNHWASDYVLYEGGTKDVDEIVLSYASHSSNGSTGYDYTAVGHQDPYELFLTFDGADSNEFSVRAITYDNGTETDVVEMTLDGNQYGELTIADFIADIDDEGNPHNPLTFALSPAAPNPSKGSATIGFALPRSCEVELSIFDIKGRKVATPAEGAYESGEYQVKINGLDSGIYLYRLRADEYSDTKKMVVK
ncbi:MAG: T9SS type A sorting domain-containing protein [bacterium]|nr:T9SS type A sorting domain-containing protein [bacterium]